MPTHLTTPGYGPCGFVQPQRFTTDTTHLGSVLRRRPFQGLIDGSPRSANSSGGRRRPQPDDDYPPAKFGLTIIRQNSPPWDLLRDWKVQLIGGIFGDSAEGKRGPQRCFKKMWSNFTGREQYGEDII